MNYPNQIFETVLRTPRREFCPQMTEFLPNLAYVFNSAVAFNFGDQREANEHVEFALDLYERGLFRLPYPIVCYMSMREASDGSRMGSSIFLMHSGGNPIDASSYGIWGFTCGPRRMPDGRIDGVIPQIITPGVRRLEKVVAQKFAADIELDAYPLLCEETSRLVWPTYEDLRKHMAQVILAGFGMTVMLMSKGVELVRASPPTKLNRNRERQGKPLIGERVTVKLTLGPRKIIETEAGEEDITGHARNSPRPHWRRGHFRMLPTGIVIPVAPAMIGMGGNEIAKPVYELARAHARGTKSQVA